MPTLSSDNDTSDSEPDDLLSSIYEQTPRSDPHIQQTERCRQFLEATGDISDRVLQVLELMDELHLNLPVFLWAISWNVPELTSNPVVRFARTALMVSDELPGILAHWHRPPRFHGQGIRTKAANKALNGWALDAIYGTLDDELAMLKPIMSLPPGDLSEETLLSISLKEMIPEVKSTAPTLWQLFRYTLRTPRQAEHNKYKDPNAVQFDAIYVSRF